MPFVHILSMALSLCNNRAKWVIAAENLWPANLKIFTLALYRKKKVLITDLKLKGMERLKDSIDLEDIS